MARRAVVVSNYLTAISAVAEAVTIHTLTEYSWCGRATLRLPAALRRMISPATARNVLLHQLQTQLYRDFYCPGQVIPHPRAGDHPAGAGHGPFATQLAAANHGQGYWRPTRSAGGTDSGRVAVEADGLLVYARATDSMFVSTGPSPGEPGELRFPKDLLGISPGFYLALSDNPLTTANHQRLIRLYWHLDPAGALGLMEQITRQLNAIRAPFKLKVLNDPEQFTRCDAAVLYVRQEDFADLVGSIGRIYSTLIGYLRARTPSFTKPLAPGLGLAESPSGGHSFGLHRCRLLADGLIRAHESGIRQVEDRVQQVVTRFAEDGINLEQPFLSFSRRDAYQLDLPPAPAYHVSPLPPATLTGADAAACLGIAVHIGQRLCDSAIWDAGQCNWIGPVQLDRQGTGTPALVHRALAPDLYAGTSGIALFLAELWVLTLDEAFRQTALGALRQALTYAETIPPRQRTALYTGWGGLALAAVRAGLLFEDDMLLDRARQLAQRLCIQEQTSEYDYLSGTAGTIIALLLLADALDQPTFVPHAVRLGDRLIQAAERRRWGYSWRTPHRSHGRNLTGLSHGAAGIGYALLELAQTTGEGRFRAVAEQAFAYEQYWFDPAVGNWPDFREGYAASRHGPVASYAIYWCHGAPGIALTRLRAYQLLGTQAYREVANAALATTRAAVRSALDRDRSDFCLCHGLSGNAEVIRYGWQVLGSVQQEDLELVDEVASWGIAHYSEQGKHWPCGIDGVEVPGLLLGLAGIGLFYLRLHNGQIGSVLLPHLDLPHLF